MNINIASDIECLRRLEDLCRSARAALEFAAEGYKSRLEIPLVGEADMTAPADAQSALQVGYNAKVAEIKSVAAELGGFE